MEAFLFLLFLQVLSLCEQLGDTGHSLADKITTSPLSFSTYTHPSSSLTTLGAYPSLSSTLSPHTTPLKYPPSLSSLPRSTPPSLEPFKLTFSLPSSSSSTTSSSRSLAVSVPGSDGAAVPSGPSAHPATGTDEHRYRSTYMYSTACIVMCQKWGLYPFN